VSLSLDDVTVDTFAPLIGAKVEAAPDAGGPAIVLLEVCESAPVGSSHPGGRQAFSVLFSGPAAPALQQGLYWLRHVALGELGIFLVPIARVDGGMRYEAIFN